MKIRSFYHLPLSSIQWLLGGLSLAVLPLALQLSPLMIVAFVGCLIWRFVLERKGAKIPGIWSRGAVGVVGLLLVLGLHNGSLIGLIPGMSLLLMLIALKVLEMRTEREFMLLAFLAFFILLTALFFSQTLLTCLYVGAVFLVLTATILQFTSGAGEGLRLRQLLRQTVLIVLQATPLIALFFVFLPRMKGGLLFQIPKTGAAESGMSEQINPGSFSELALSEEVAFRADFPEGTAPEYPLLYWRAAVFTKCGGMSWRRESANREVFRRPLLTGRRVVQRISMEPHSGAWAYGLDRPDSPSPGDGPIFMAAGSVLTLHSSTLDRLAPIRVVSHLGNETTPLSPEARIALTDYPKNAGPRSRQLVDSWLRETHRPREIVARALRLFHSENFRYTLSPGAYGSNALDEFIFERRQGFCEHYAAAFGTLMRMAGLPTRMVAGYHGGEPNPFGTYLIIRQSDAHAWTEVWIEGEGWVRFDPADAINPSRMDLDTQVAARHNAAGETGNESRTASAMPDFLEKIIHSARLGWDMVDFQWNLRVLSYDQSSQREFYHALGISSPFSWRLAAILMLGVLLVLGTVYWMGRRRTAAKDRFLASYHELCEALARAGMPRRSQEGPRDFATRAETFFPENAAEFREIFQIFIRVRYGSGPTKRDFPEIAALVQALKARLRAGKREMLLQK